MKDWASKKYHYKIINETGSVIAFMHDYLLEVEKFVIKSKMHISKIERKGIEEFDISVTSDPEWKIL
jgi:hypothetical protein